MKSLGVFFGGVGGVLTYIFKPRLEARARERQIYEDIETRYLEVNKLILKYPALDVSWFADTPDRPLSEDERLQQHVMFEIITRLFEHTYLTCRNASSPQRQRQWSGWEAFMEDYCKKSSYQKWWQKTV